MDYDHQPKYAIREVALKTGVKPVTLRAWQRRYNLLDPQRTEKGHRLFSDHDIATINLIQGWLAKGVSIGNVAKLLKNSVEDPNLCDFTIENQELIECDELRCAIAELNRGKAQLIISAVLREYPLSMVEAQFITSVITTLDKVKTPLRSMQKGLLQSLLLSQLAFVIEAENKASSKGKRLFVNLNSTGCLYAWLQATVSAEQGYYIVLLDGVDDFSGLIGFKQIERFDSIELYSSQPLNDAQIEAYKKLIAHNLKVVLSGNIVMLNQKELG